MLESISLLLKEYVPNLDCLPEFLMSLGPQVFLRFLLDDRVVG